MFENNKYLLIFLIIIGFGIFTFLVYKIIKSNETIKELEEDKRTLENLLSSKDFTIKQFSNGKHKKIERSDHETDYCHGKAPIEVFNNNATELNAVKSSKILQTSEQITTPQIVGKLKVITDAVTNVALSKTNVKSNSPIITLLDNDVSIKDNDQNEEDSMSTLSFIDQAIASNNIADIKPSDFEGLSDTMYIVTGKEEDDEEDGNHCEEEEGETDGEDEEDDDEDGDEEDDEEKDDEDKDEDEEEDDDSNDEDEDDNSEYVKVSIENDDTEENTKLTSSNTQLDVVKSDEEYEYEEYEYEEYEVEYDEEENNRREQNKLRLVNLPINEIRIIAKQKNIKLSSNGKTLNKNDLIERILEYDE